MDKDEIKKIQKLLKNNNFDIKIDGVWGKNTEKAFNLYSKRKVASAKSKKTGISSIVRDISKAVGVPLNARQFIHDLSGGKQTISEKDLTLSELNSLRKIVRNNLKDNKYTISYEDYNIGSKDLESKSNTSSNTLSESFKNDTYNLRSTLGQAKIDIIGKDTIVTDTYDFNDAPKGRDTLSFGNKFLDMFNDPAKGTGDSGFVYRSARNIGKQFGSSPHEGGGSESIINITEKKLDPLPDRNRIEQDSIKYILPEINVKNQKFKIGGKLSDKLFMQSGGYKYHNNYDLAEKALNVPLYTAAGFGQGIMTGKGLGFNENSQKQLGVLSAANNGLNALASLNNTRTRRNEELERFREDRRNDYYTVPQDRYRYNEYSNSPYSQDYFKNGGELSKKLREYKHGGYVDINLNAGTRDNHAGNFHNTSMTKRLYDEYHPVNYKSTSNNSVGFSDVVGRRVPKYLKYGGIPTSYNGLHEYPNQPVNIPSGRISMQSIPYPVLAFPDNDKPTVMKPNREYNFKNSNNVFEIPLR